MRPSGVFRRVLAATFALSASSLAGRVALAQTAAPSAEPAPSAAPAAQPPSAPAQTAAPDATGATPAPAPSAAPAPAPEPPAQPAPLGAVALVDTAPLGVDPEAATFVNGVLRQSLTQMGYGVVPTARMYEAARSLALPFPVPPEGLSALLHSLSTPVGVTGELRAGGGYYYYTLRVRFANEPAERSRQLVASQWTLGDTLRAALSAMLAPPGSAAASAYSMGAPPGPFTYPGPTYGPGGPYGGGMQPIAAPRPAVPAHPQRFELAGFGLAALGPGNDSFANALFGARFAWLPYDRFGVTGSLAYANLRGRSGRVSNVLPMLGVETAVDVLPDLKIFLPLRAEVGYLPYNGAVFRATAGASFALSRSIRLEADLLQATIWLIPGTVAVSIDLGVQLIFGLGDRDLQPSAASTTAPSDGAQPTRRRRRRRTRPAGESAPETPANSPADSPPAP